MEAALCPRSESRAQGEESTLTSMRTMDERPVTTLAIRAEARLRTPRLHLSPEPV
jgi:hypothetical protein